MGGKTFFVPTYASDMLEKVYEKKQYLRKRKVPEEGEEDWEVALERRSGEKRQRQ